MLRHALPLLKRSFATGPRPIFPKKNDTKNADVALYTASVVIGVIGVTYAAVPLYRLFCQATGFNGTVRTTSLSSVWSSLFSSGSNPNSVFSPEDMIPRRDTKRKIKITFNADTAAAMPWQFQPEQPHVYVYPGETSLAFYQALNPTEKDIVGVSTYNVVPLQAGAYFNKIQCFCFEEQKLKAGERVDMPVFFFLDPEFDDDPLMRDVSEVTLSYTFFPVKR